MSATPEVTAPALEGEVMPATGTTIAEYSKTETALAALRERYDGKAYDVTTTAGMALAREGRAELRTLRVELEATRQQLKAPVLEQGRILDAEAKRITEALVALEQPIDKQIKNEERRKAEIREALEKIERERQAALTTKIDALRAFPLLYVAAPVGVLGAAIASKEGVPPTAEEFSDRLEEATATHTAMMAQLRALLTAAEDRAAEQAKIDAQQAELEALLETQRKRDAEAVAEQQKRDAEAQAARDEADRVAQAKRDEDDRIARVERDNLAEIQRREQAKLDEAARAERERQQAEADERERVAQVARDAVAAEEAERAEAERIRLETAKAAEAADRLEKEQRIIQTATLVMAANAAADLLHSLGQSGHVITRTLVSALAREPKAIKPRAKKVPA